MEGKLKHWLHANVAIFNQDTLSLIPEERRVEYAQVMARLAFASEHLIDSLTAVQRAHQNIVYAHEVRDQFFESVQSGTTTEQPTEPTI